MPPGYVQSIYSAVITRVAQPVVTTTHEWLEGRCGAQMCQWAQIRLQIGPRLTTSKAAAYGDSADGCLRRLLQSVPEEYYQDDDRDGDAKKPEKNSATHSYFLQLPMSRQTRRLRPRSGASRSGLEVSKAEFGNFVPRCPYQHEVIDKKSPQHAEDHTPRSYDFAPSSLPARVDRSSTPGRHLLLSLRSLQPRTPGAETQPRSR
jgi:hypothetical protein